MLCVCVCVCVWLFAQSLFVCAIFYGGFLYCGRHFIGIRLYRHSSRIRSVPPSFLCAEWQRRWRRRRLISLSSFLLVFFRAQRATTPARLTLQCRLPHGQRPTTFALPAPFVPHCVCIQNLLIPRARSCFKVKIPHADPTAYD